MASAYGHKWTSSYGESDDGTWLAGLRDLTQDQMRDGLERVLTSGREWPPSLPEFRNICLNREEKEKNQYGLYHTPQHLQQPYENDALALPDKTYEEKRKEKELHRMRTKAVRDDELSKIKNMLRMKR